MSLAAIKPKTAWELALGDEEYLDLYNELELEIEQCVPRSQKLLKRLDALTIKFETFTEHTWPKLKGKEFDIQPKKHPPLERRIFIFLASIVEHSKSIKRKGERMHYHTLLGYRYLMLNLMYHGANPSPTQRRQWEVESIKWANVLQRTYKLRTEVDRRVPLGADEIKLMALAALTEPASYLNAIQHVCAFVIELMTGARPGSLFSTRDYPECYILVEHAWIWREGPIARFTAEIDLVWFKGCHDAPKKLSYMIRSTDTLSNLQIDLAFLLITIGIRRQLFQDYTNVRDLIQGQDHQLRWKEEVKKQPLLLQSKPRGTGVTDKPMTDVNHRDFLKRVGHEVGVGGSLPHDIQLYGFREKHANEVTKKMGHSTTRTSMAHQPDSNTLEVYYLHLNPTVDFAGALYNEVMRDMPDRNSAALNALRNPVAAPLSLPEMCERIPLLTVLIKQAEELKEAHILQDNEWRRLFYCPEMLKDDTTLEHAIDWTTKRTKRLMREAQKAHQVEHRTAQRAQQHLTLQDLAEARRELDKPKILDILAQANKNSSRSLQFDDGIEDGGPVEISFDLQTLDGYNAQAGEQVVPCTEAQRTEYLINLCEVKEKKPGYGPCDLCAEDPHVTDPKDLKRIYSCSSTYLRHVQGSHNARAAATRLVQLRNCKDEDDTQYLCWICKEEGGPITFYYNSHGLGELGRHMLLEHLDELDGDEMRVLMDVRDCHDIPTINEHREELCSFFQRQTLADPHVFDDHTFVRFKAHDDSLWADHEPHEFPVARRRRR